MLKKFSIALKGVKTLECKMRLAELLAQKGMKQADLCRAAGISTSLLSQYSTGKTPPTLDKAQAIARALGVTLDELVGWKPKKVLETQTLECTADEAELIRMFRALDASGQRRTMRHLRGEYEDAMASFGEESLSVTSHG